MIRRIRPVSRIIKIETEIERKAENASFLGGDVPGLNHAWAPAVDISEKDEEIVVEIELPGVLEKDIRITLHGTRIEVKGKKRESRISGGMRFHRLEREYGTFRRMILIPAAVVPERTSAALENGILTIVLRKSPRRTREIKVTIGKSDE
jgi:HSP20 family protein